LGSVDDKELIFQKLEITATKINSSDQMKTKLLLAMCCFLNSANTSTNTGKEKIDEMEFIKPFLKYGNRLYIQMPHAHKSGVYGIDVKSRPHKTVFSIYMDHENPTFFKKIFYHNNTGTHFEKEVVECILQKTFSKNSRVYKCFPANHKFQLLDDIIQDGLRKSDLVRD